MSKRSFQAPIFQFQLFHNLFQYGPWYGLMPGPDPQVGRTRALCLAPSGHEHVE